eukprot:314807_1
MFIIINKKYCINYSNMVNIKWVSFYGKFIVITNMCLCIHYFLYEMKHKEHIYEDRHDEPPKYPVDIIRILVAFFNIEFYLAAIERIDLYEYLLIHDDIEYEIDVYQPPNSSFLSMQVLNSKKGNNGNENEWNQKIEEKEQIIESLKLEMKQKIKTIVDGHQEEIDKLNQHIFNVNTENTKLKQENASILKQLQEKEKIVQLTENEENVDIMNLINH